MKNDLANRREVDLSVPIHKLPLWVWVLSFILFLLPLLLYRLIYSVDLSAFFNLWTLPALVVLIVTHELIHAAAWKFASGLHWSHFKFGIDRRTLSPFCHAKAPMGVTAYRIGAGAPLLIVGIIPYIAALVVASPWLAGLMAMMISAAVGDIFVLWTLRNLPDDALVLDHPSQAGCIAYLRK